MRTLEILAAKSLSISNRQKEIDGNYLLIGKCFKSEFISYLYFDLHYLPPNTEIKKAELILYEAGKYCYYNNIPCIFNYLCGCRPEGSFNEQYAIYPLTDYFSSRTKFNNQPAYTTLYTQEDELEGTVSVQVGITSIVEHWMSGQLSNKGIILKRREGHSKMVCLGSAVNWDITLIPSLKISFNEFSFPVAELNCSYKVIPPIRAGE